jgi:hypothetical protein
MENDPDKLNDPDDASIGDETGDVDVDEDDLGESDDEDPSQSGIDPTLDIMNDGGAASDSGAATGTAGKPAAPTP